MKTLLISIILILLTTLGCNYAAFAQGYQNSPVLPEGSNPPAIITQVELASPFALFPDNQTCYDKPGFASAYTCTTDIIPGHKVQCGYFIGSKTCEPIHQYTSGTNQNCLGSKSFSHAPQWFDVYNTLNKTIQLQYFTVKVPTPSGSYSEDGPYYAIPNIGPHEKCTYGFYPIDEPISLDPTNKTILISYDYDGKHYTASTPLLSDVYNDNRTWQYDKNKWIFADNSIQPNFLISPLRGYPPFNEAYSSNPVIITQVELATPLQPGNQSGTDCVTYSNGTNACHSYSSPYHANTHSPYYNIQCAFFNGVCQLTHQVQMLDNQCDSLQQYPQGTQWIQIYNQMNSTVHLTHFGVTRILDEVLHLQDMPPQYAGSDYAGYTNLTMSPHQICSYGFIAGPIGSALEFPLNDTSLAVVYDYNGVHHVAATPFLVDLYNDSKTWQYDGSQWVFTDSVVSVPEFPFSVPVMLIGIISTIVFYKIRFRK